MKVAFSLSALALAMLLGGCARPVGDFGRPEPEMVHDDLMPAAGTLRAAAMDEPVSGFDLSDEETDLSNRIWRFETSGHVRDWLYDNATELERTRLLPPPGPAFTPDRYYNWLHGTAYQSAKVRYATLWGDVEADIATLPATFAAICRVEQVDRERRQAAQNLPTGPGSRADLAARLAENSQQIAGFVAAINYRYRSYNYALDHLLVETPYPAARRADRDLVALRLQLADADRGDFCGDGEMPAGAPEPVEPALPSRYEHSAPRPAGPVSGS